MVEYPITATIKIVYSLGTEEDQTILFSKEITSEDKKMICDLLYTEIINKIDINKYSTLTKFLIGMFT